MLYIPQCGLELAWKWFSMQLSCAAVLLITNAYFLGLRDTQLACEIAQKTIELSRPHKIAATEKNGCITSSSRVGHHEPPLTIHQLGKISKPLEKKTEHSTPP
ncbi:hypothetical protein VNO78_07400 [Psophocarpus tetragonolobus]|uniref:Uncharacterized protein n=1 Tax=Psophocarpus tetragonolobus TaxID=3891 RepID=A0AAN9STD3_PSOTE